MHTIEDSPHRKGSAYVSVYRMYFNDFKPYLYMTNDYGEHWTLLTDGTNGIPADQPMHVVREDPEQEGLLYAGTLQGAYVSFDNGKHWQTLQQNLPARRSPTSRSTTAICSRRRWGDRSGSWTTSRRCGRLPRA